VKRASAILEPGAVSAERERRWNRYEVGLVLAWWGVYGVWLTGQNLLVTSALDVPVGTGEIAARAFFGAATWAALTLFVFRLVRAFPLDRRPRLLALAVHVVGGAAVALGEILITRLVGPLLGWPAPDPLQHLLEAFPANIVYYWLLVGVGHGLRWYRYYRQRESDAAELGRRLVQAELHLLKSQLHPHFLFNTLHAISALMHRDVRAADRMLARLSQLLRVALDYSGTHEVSLQEELDFLEPYIEIEQVRLGDRLNVTMDIEPATLDAKVPHMILQPIVENAIRHGIAPRASPGSIAISARTDGDLLVLEVQDDGPGLAPGRTAAGGLGLANTRARLAQLYGDRFSFDPHNGGGGFRVRMRIPYRSVRSTDVPEEEEAVA
jgi:two-component system LytT family sensor kinase